MRKIVTAIVLFASGSAFAQIAPTDMFGNFAGKYQVVSCQDYGSSPSDWCAYKEVTVSNGKGASTAPTAMAKFDFSNGKGQRSGGLSISYYATGEKNSYFESDKSARHIEHSFACT